MAKIVLQTREYLCGLKVSIFEFQFFVWEYIYNNLWLEVILSLNTINQSNLYQEFVLVSNGLHQWIDAFEGKFYRRRSYIETAVKILVQKQRLKTIFWTLKEEFGRCCFTEGLKLLELFISVAYLMNCIVNDRQFS